MVMEQKEEGIIDRFSPSNIDHREIQIDELKEVLGNRAGEFRKLVDASSGVNY